MATVYKVGTRELGALFNELSVLQSAGPDDPRVRRSAETIGIDSVPNGTNPATGRGYIETFLLGTGFTFDAAGRPTGGTVTYVEAVPAGLSVGPLPGASGLKAPLTTLYAAAVQGAGEAVVPGSLSGSDLFITEAESAETLYGYGGDDLFRVDRGLGPSLDGGAGADTVEFANRGRNLRRDFTVEVRPGSLFVDRPDLGERVTYTSVETIRFDDGTLIFDPAAVGGQVYVLFQAALGRAPSAAEPGVGYFLDAVRSYGLSGVAPGLLAAPEARARLDGLDDAAFVDAVYRAALGRGAEPDGLGYWRGRLDAVDGGRSAALAGIAASDEAEARFAPVLAPGFFAADLEAVGTLRRFLAATGAPPDGDSLLSFTRRPPSAAADSLAQESIRNGLSDADFVASLVRNAYGPDASDPDAVAYYTQALGSGGGTRGDVVQAYASSPGMDARIASYVTNEGVLFA